MEPKSYVISIGNFDFINYDLPNDLTILLTKINTILNSRGTAIYNYILKCNCPQGPRILGYEEISDIGKIKKIACCHECHAMLSLAIKEKDKND
jgi:hypothetical protein